MLAVYLQPDSVKVVQGKLRKDNTLEVKEYEDLSKSYINRNYLDILSSTSSSEENDYEYGVNNFADLFRDIKKISKYKRESIYLVLPDFLFYGIDCFSYDKEADMEE